MTEPTNPGLASGRRCIAAIRSLLGLFPVERESAVGSAGAVDVPTFVAEADQLAIYQLLAINAALVRWMSAETNRPESEIVDEIARNDEQGMIFEL